MFVYRCFKMHKFSRYRVLNTEFCDRFHRQKTVITAGLLARILKQSLCVLLCMYSPFLSAQTKKADCKTAFGQVQQALCQASSNQQQYQNLKQKYQRLQSQFLATKLISNAPLHLLMQQHHFWHHYLLKCRHYSCFEQHLALRQTQLLEIKTINQSFNQHYRLVKNNIQPESVIELQLQQLEKNRIKIEAQKYQNPKQDLKQPLRLRAYSMVDQLQKIQDLENQCPYQVIRFKYAVQLKALSKKAICQHFVGLYKLYD